MVRGPVYFQTHTETDTHENDAVLQKRPESYQSKVKNVILPKENQKKVNYFEESNNKLPTPIRPTEPLEVIRRDCGELCNTSRDGSPGPYFNHVTAQVNCQALFKNEFIDRTHGLPHAPKVIPKHLMSDFTMNGRLKVYEWYFDQPYLEEKALSPVWSKEMVEQWITLAKQGKLGGNYGIPETNALRDGLQHAPGVKNGRVLVIGSENPWVEACVLEAGAKEIVTLEYGEIISKHPKIKTMTPLQFRKSYLSDTLGTFDAIVTFSSVEHSGLGRYGDALNPWGDIIAIARAWCLTKQGGSLTIGVMYDYNNDCIRFNAGRWYGKVRFPYLATNWKQFYRGQGSQRVHVFTNGNVKPTLDLPVYLKPPSPYKYINNTNVAYSQAKQDQTVYHLFPKKNGFFIEMGAFDGMSLSNTLWLERHHNWTGLLIEANPDLCDAIDKHKRRVWRLCACISTESSTTFIKGGALGSAKDTVDKDHLKQLNPALTVTVLCFKLDTVLDKIQQSHIDYFSLDVEGAELFVLNSMKNELKSGKIIVDVWTIEYRVWDGTKIIVDKSKNNLEGLRNFFKDVHDYVEHSQLSITADTSDGMALDVVFVYIKSWCQKYQTLPSGAKC